MEKKHARIYEIFGWTCMVIGGIIVIANNPITSKICYGTVTLAGLITLIVIAIKGRSAKTPKKDSGTNDDNA
jgi:hypothetical protein